MQKSQIEPARRRRLMESPVVRARTGNASLAEVAAHAASCRDCPLWKNATQTVFGEGPQSARIVLVGEQPGDQEDIEGRPFVGPAGRLLDKALRDAGVDRKRTYVTNAVKHFKFEMRGKRRLHKTPSQLEVAACHQWLERELDLIQPDLIVVLGATAARAVFGRVTQINKNRGRIIPARNETAGRNADLLVTVHPSFLLRVPPEDRDAAYGQFVGDLELAAQYTRKRGQH
jgi:uracil-DNA glycosylase family protein